MNKTRVYEVARELGLDNGEIVKKLAALGIQVRNHMSSIDTADADRIKRTLEKEKQSNVVEERIRPTVVRRRAVRSKDDEDDAPDAAAAAPAVARSPQAAAPSAPTPAVTRDDARENRPQPRPARQETPPPATPQSSAAARNPMTPAQTAATPPAKIEAPPAPSPCPMR